MMLVVNYVLYGCFLARLTPGVSLYQSLTLEEKIVAVITQDRVIDSNLEKQFKKKFYVLVDYSKDIIERGCTILGNALHIFYCNFYCVGISLNR